MLKPGAQAAARVPATGTTGRIVRVNVSRGGVPKRPVPSARVTREGVDGDRQADRRYHGGRDRAVSLFALEVIERIAAEGHPIAPGTTGENLTLAGFDWEHVRPGAQLRFAGGVELEVTDFASPCPTIRDSFLGGDFERLSEKRHPGSSRLYCRVLREGDVRAGEGVTVVPARD